MENPLLMIFIIGVIADMPMKGDEMEGTCSLRGKGAKCVQDCSRKVLRRPTAVSGRSRSAVSRLLGLWFQKKIPALGMDFFSTANALYKQTPLATCRSLLQGSPTKCLYIIACDQVQH